MTTFIHNSTSHGQIHSYVFTFEEKFSPDKAREWMLENRSKGFVFCALYAFLIFSLKFYMHNKPRYVLRKSLILWSALLSIFSICGSLRTVPELFYMLSNGGLYDSICSSSPVESIKVCECWFWLFAISKLAEFGDTMFIVLRKQPLMFLHWYHHITVLLYTWYAYSDNDVYSRWFRSMNYTVHAFMYSYYTIRASGYTVPRLVMIVITLMQIIQMVMGCAVNYMGYFYLSSNRPCQLSRKNMVYSSLMYFSYLILFSRFFYNSYIKPSRKTNYSSIPTNIGTKSK